MVDERPHRGVIGLTVVIAVVIQTTLFGRLRVVTPDLVMLIGILLALTRVRTEAVLGFAFLSGLIMGIRQEHRSSVSERSCTPPWPSSLSGPGNEPSWGG